MLEEEDFCFVCSVSTYTSIMYIYMIRVYRFELLHY